MARDALEHHLDENGRPVFTNLPRREDGTLDRQKLGGEPYDDPKFGRVDPQPSVPSPRGPARPIDQED